MSYPPSHSLTHTHSYALWHTFLAKARGGLYCSARMGKMIHAARTPRRLFREKDWKATEEREKRLLMGARAIDGMVYFSSRIRPRVVNGASYSMNMCYACRRRLLSVYSGALVRLALHSSPPALCHHNSCSSISSLPSLLPPSASSSGALHVVRV